MPSSSTQDFLSVAAPSLSRERVAIQNTLTGEGRSLAFTIDGIEGHIRFGGNIVPANSAGLWCDISVSGQKVRFMLNDPAFVPLLRTLISEAPVPDAVPPDLLAAVVEVLIEPLRARLGEVLVLDRTGLGTPNASPEALEWTLGFSISGANDAHLSDGTLLCTDAIAAKLAAAVSENGAVSPATEIDVDAVGRVQLRGLLLPLDEFNRLEVMDILTFGAFGTGGGIQARVFFAPRLFYVGTLDGEVLRMQQEPKNDQQDDGSPVSDTGPVDLSKLPVRINFELGSVNVTLDELRRMSEGTVIEIPVPLDAPVSLRANGREIGKGALLRIEDHIGVRILELNKE